jgi:hypothetical protein
MAKKSLFQRIFDGVSRPIRAYKAAFQEEKEPSEDMVASALMDLFGSNLKEWKESLPEYDPYGEREDKWVEASYLIYKQTGLTLTPSNLHGYVRTLIREKWVSADANDW